MATICNIELARIKDFRMLRTVLKEQKDEVHRDLNANVNEVEEICNKLFPGNASSSERDSKISIGTWTFN